MSRSATGTRPAMKYALSGDDLKQQRLAYDVTQTAVAEHMGVGEPRVSKLERQRLVEGHTARRYLAACREAVQSQHERARVAVEKARAEERDREIQQRHEEWQEEATARAAAQELELVDRMPAREPAEATDVYVQGVGYVPVAMLTRARIRPPSSPRRY